MARWKNFSLKLRWQIALTILAMILIGGYLVWDISTSGPMTRLFNDRELLIQIVNQNRVLAPMIYMGLQILQTIVAPIPGGIVGPIGGFLFGWWGILWTMLGSTIGATCVFLISRKFGRGLALKLTNDKEFKKFDIIPEKRAEMMILVLFLIPGLPDDTICYLAGLTKVPVRRLVMHFAIGRLPSVIVANYIGMGVEEGNAVKILVIIGLVALGLGVITIQKDSILSFLKSKEH